MQNDAEKIVRTFTNEKKSGFVVKVNNRQPNLNFIRRLKINSMKVRKKANNMDSTSVIV